MLALFSLVLSISVVRTKLVVSSFAELYREDGSLDGDLIINNARLVSEVTQRSSDCPDIEEMLRVYEYFLINEDGEEEQILMDAQLPIDLENVTMTMTNQEEPWIKSDIGRNAISTFGDSSSLFALFLRKMFSMYVVDFDF